MATSNLQDICRLCLCCKLVRMESRQTHDILSKVSKYLYIQMEQSSVALCANCCRSLEDFHSFYEGVHSARKNFHSLQRKILQSVSTQTTEKDTDTIGMEFDNHTPPRSNRGDNNCVSDVPAKNDNKSSETEGLQSPKMTELEGKEVVKERQRESEKGGISDIEKKMMEFYNIKCEKCEYIKFTSFKMLSRHYSTVHKTQGYIKCCKRNIKVNNKSYLRSHMLKHLEPDSCRCTICGKQLSSTMTLKHHMLLHKPAEERPFQCSKCDKRFCCKNDLKNHEKAIHVPESEREDFICDVCGKVFQKVTILRYHYSTVHLQERKYVCELCAKCFTTPSGLKVHRNAAHNTAGPIQCQECGKWLKNEDTFQKHLQLHQNNTYPCSQCSKVCNSSTSLRSHMVKHSDKRPHSCVVCRKSFKTKTHLKNHSVQHSGGSSYKCPFCSKTFTSISNYYTHRKRMHLDPVSGKARRDGSSGGDVKNDDELYGSADACKSDQTYAYDYKGGVDSGMVMQPSDIVRQNIIVSPVNMPLMRDFD